MATYKWLEMIREGMSVMDRDDNRVGTVKQVYLGSDTEDVSNPAYTRADVAPLDTEYGRNDAVAGIIGESLVGARDIPDAVLNRLMNQGFVQIDRGLLRGDGFALAEQVVGVDDDGVRLSIAQGDLVTG